MTITKVFAKTALAGALALCGLGLAGGTSAIAAPYHEGDRAIVSYQVRPAFGRNEYRNRWQEERCERRRGHRHERRDWRRRDRDDYYRR